MYTCIHCISYTYVHHICMYVCICCIVLFESMVISVTALITVTFVLYLGTVSSNQSSLHWVVPKLDGDLVSLCKNIQICFYVKKRLTPNKLRSICHIYVDMWPDSENLNAFVLPFAGAASLFFPYTGCHSGRPCDWKIWRAVILKKKIHKNNSDMIMTLVIMMDSCWDFFLEGTPHLLSVMMMIDITIMIMRLWRWCFCTIPCYGWWCGWPWWWRGWQWWW